jgi:hypothetical protein
MSKPFISLHYIIKALEVFGYVAVLKNDMPEVTTF